MKVELRLTDNSRQKNRTLATMRRPKLVRTYDFVEPREEEEDVDDQGAQGISRSHNMYSSTYVHGNCRQSVPN